MLIVSLLFSGQLNKVKWSSEAYCSMSQTQTEYKYVGVKELNQKVEELEKKCDKYFRLIFKILKQQEGFNIELFEDVDTLEKEMNKLRGDIK
jgi:hypothetical protein